MKITDDFVFFFGKEDYYSNWHIAPFSYRDFEFNCVEQFMMFSKAKLFNDHETAEKILMTHSQFEQKALGRQVKNFDSTVWDAKCESIVAVGCREKFLQNPQLLTHILSMGNREFVEASPYDKIWGVGLGVNDTQILDKTSWRGQNKLGVVLGKVRDTLTQQNHPTPKKHKP